MEKVWKVAGFDDFSKGVFCNGGQNLYVSKQGVLQRIFRFDINRDGYCDIVFVNSQDMNERPPVYVCKNLLDQVKITELPTAGAYAGAVGDLDGNGYDDIVIANQHNGIHSDITAYIYYGSHEGFTEKYKRELPAPNCRAVAIGDFNCDGRADIAFSSDGKLRIFYQGKEGFDPSEYIDLDLEITHMAAQDLDGDGFADLYIRLRGGKPCVLWGGVDGINLERLTIVGGEDSSSAGLHSSTQGKMNFVEGWAPKILSVNNKYYLFRVENEAVSLYPVLDDRMLGIPLILDCANGVSVATGDINGNGIDDIVIAVCSNHNVEETSWIYWGTENGYSNKDRTPIATKSARDVAVVDLDGDGFMDVIICQGWTDVLYTTCSLVFRGCREGVMKEPNSIETHDATSVLVAQSNDCKIPQIVFINHEGGRVRGDVPAYVYYGSKNGFSIESRDELPGWSATDSVCCDFNDNGWADIFLCNCAENAPHLDPGSYLYRGGPDGFDINDKLVFPTNRGNGCAVGDFRHSGYLDIAVGGFANSEILIYKGGPAGFDLQNPQRLTMDESLVSFSRQKHPIQEIAEMYESHSLELCEPGWLLSADFNNDGWLDLVITQISGKRCFVLWGGEDGFDMMRSTQLNIESGTFPQAADLNGDGWLDLVIGGYQSSSKKWVNDSYVYIYWGSSEGFSETRRTQLPAHAADSITIADFNNDGILDIFVGSYHGGRMRDLDSYIYWGASGGVYSASNCKRLFTHSASGCKAIDYNEDGWIDIAVANHKTEGNHQGLSNIWWNGPEGFSEQNVTMLPTLGPHGMMTVDAGNIMDRGNEEYYISLPYLLPEGANVTKIYWEAEIQPKTWVKAQVRFACSIEELASAKWYGPGYSCDWFENGQAVELFNLHGNLIQYRLALGSINGGNSPRVSEVSVHYTY